MPNQTIKFKKKAYNESTDSGAGIVVFDTSKHKVYVGGVCYSSDVADASYNGENRKLSITKRDGSSTSIDIPDILSSTTIRIYRNLTGTAGTSTRPYNHAKWDVTDETITEYVDGMVVSIKVPVAGLKYGVGFQINNLGYKPVVYNVNTTIGTRYGVGSVVWCQYNSTQTAPLNVNSDTATTVTGCWQVMDYSSGDTNTIGYQLRTNTSIRPTLTRTRYNRILFSNPDNTKWIPANTGYDNSATSQKTVNQNPINPFGRIVYCGSTSNFAAGANVTATVTWDQYTLELGYSFNTTGAALTLTYPAPVYVKCAPQADGSAIIDSTQPYVQVLPSTNDGKIYIYLGQAYSATNIELEINHPVFYHDGGGIRVWTGATPESDLFDCVMTSETVNNETVWSCNHTWGEIYAAHQAGKFVRLFEGVSDMYMPVVISNNSGVFSTCAHLSLGTLSESSFINSFWYDEGTWSYHVQNFKAFTDTYKSKLDGIAAGAEVNVQADWNQSDNTADDYIKNKPTIPTVNNKTITIQKNGTTVDSFTTNASSNKTINITGVQDQITSTNKLSADLISDGDTNKVFTATEQSKLSGIAAGAEVNVQADWNQTTNTADDYIKNKPTIPTVNNKTITIQKNGTTVDSFTTNASANKTINITVPTSAADVSALPSSTKYAASIDLSINSTTYVVTAQLKDQDGNNLGTADTIDLPLESVVVNGSYNNSTKKVVLTLQSGSTVEFSVADLVSGLQSEITSTNKLSADLITDGNTNKVFTSTEKTKLSGIAAGAEVNVQADWNQTTASADDYIKNKPTIPTVNDSTITIQKNGTTVDTFTTNASSAKTINITGVQNEITSNSKLSADLVSDGTTNKVFTATEQSKLANIAAGAEVNVQSDWNQSDNTADDYIKNKPNVNEDFVCNFTMTPDTESSEEFPDNCSFTCDKSVSEIVTAVNSGKNIVGRCNLINPEDNNETVRFNVNICTSISGLEGVENCVMFSIDAFVVMGCVKFNLLGFIHAETHRDVWRTEYILTNTDIENVRNLKPVATSGTIDSLGDVDVLDVSNGDIISYNSTSGIWENKQFPVSDWNQSDSTADDYIKNKPNFSDIPITYSELKSLRDNGELVPKQTYRITDYVTMITPYIVNYVSLSSTEPATDEICECARVSPDYKQYDILVTAIDESHLSEDCRMAKHGNETYFDNLDLPSWRIKYSLDNDRSKYDWAMDYYTGTIVVDNSTVDVTIVKWFSDGKEASGTTMFFYVMFGSDTDGSDSDVYYTRTPAYSEDGTLAARSVLQIDGSSVVLDTCTHHTGKGVVYHMEDMNSNKLSYDYVNIQFKEYAPSGFSSNMDEYYSNFETSELREKIFYSTQNNVYDRFLNFYSIASLIGGSSTQRRFDIDYNNFDWYYTFDQYDATNGTHTNVFTKCYDNIIGPTYNACYNIIGTGASVYILPYNVYQFREGFLERFDVSPESPFGRIPFFVSGVRYSNNILANVFMYSSDTDMSSFLENDTTRIVNPIKSDTTLVGCAFKDCSNIKINSYSGYFLESYDLDIQGGVNALVYDSHSVKVGTSDEKITLYNSNSIWCGTRTSELTAYASNTICMGDFCSFHGVNSHYVYMGDGSAFETTDNNGGGNIMHITIGSGANVRSVDNVSDINIGNGSFVSCIQGATNISVGVYCNDISICSPPYNVGIQKVKIGDFCTNVSIGTTENPMRCENCTIEENVGYLNLYNSNADYSDPYSADVLKNLTVNKSYTTGSSNWLNVNGVPLNDIYNKRIGFNSNRVAVLYVEEDLIKQNPPTLSAITFGTDGQYLLVYFNGDEMMYGTNDGTTPSPYNHAYMVSRATTGHDYYQFTPVAGTTYKFVRYSSTDPFATSPIATYQA